MNAEGTGLETGFGPAGPPFYQQLPVGGQLGHLEYLVEKESLELYRTAVDYPDAGFPSLALEEYRQVLANKYGAMPLTSVGHQEWYYRPPSLGRHLDSPRPFQFSFRNQ